VSLVTELVCVKCGASYKPDAVATCPACGPDEGILDVRFDKTRARTTLTRENLSTRPHAIWRYRELLPIDQTNIPDDWHIGWTPLIETPRLAATVGVRRLRVKDEGRGASGSFKDRASAIGVMRAMQEGAAAIVCASTGNAASSLACCAAHMGLQANIFVSKIVPTGKLAQLLAYGARVFKIDGSYADAYALCTQACERFGWYNRNCAVNPYLVEGKKTGGMEIAEQCADDPPDWVAVSVGDGCSIAGVHKGLVQMRACGVIDWRTRLLGVQAAGVAPIAAAFAAYTPHVAADAPVGRSPANGSRNAARTELRESSDHATYADSINVPVPRNRTKALNAVTESGGAFVTITDAQIMQAVRDTGRLTGIFAEPAAAAVVAGGAEARRLDIIKPDASAAALLTGNGLKDIDGALLAVGAPHEIPPDIDRVARIVESET